ncbi:MAG: hypothetical protein ACRDVM_03370 [Acidimicrobiia bacterium]
MKLRTLVALAAAAYAAYLMRQRSERPTPGPTWQPIDLPPDPPPP